MEAVSMLASPLPSRSKRKRTFAVLLIIAILAFVPFKVNRLRQRLEASMSTALGRKVTVRNIRFHLLPQPGFDLTNFSNADDSEFTSEPLLQAERVGGSPPLAAACGR